MLALGRFIKWSGFGESTRFPHGTVLWLAMFRTLIAFSWVVVLRATRC